MSEEGYFGQYGKINEIFIMKDKKSSQNLYNAYITYNSKRAAAVAILSANNQNIGSNKIRVTYGMTRYCCFFLRKEKCLNKKCTFIHYFASKEDTTNS